MLILHGAFGLLPQYRADIGSFAEALVEQQIAAVIPHYFAATRTAAGPNALVAMVDHHSAINAGRLGAIGFSLGGHLALELGMSPPAGSALKCAVNFFGPTLEPPLRGDLATLPPV